MADVQAVVLFTSFVVSAMEEVRMGKLPLIAAVARTRPPSGERYGTLVCASAEDKLMPRYPNIFVLVSDGKPISEIIERADNAMKRAGISSAKRCEFRAGVPRHYALAVDYIRQFCETD